MEPNYSGTASGAGKYRHFVSIVLPQTSTKRTNLTQIKLGALSVDEANEWSEAILHASMDGGAPPADTQPPQKRKVREREEQYSIH